MSSINSTHPLIAVVLLTDVSSKSSGRTPIIISISLSGIEVIVGNGNSTPRLVRIAPEITSYSRKIYEHPDIGIAL